MTIKYYYAAKQYDTESEAQAAVDAMKLRLENNPSDWVKVKEITGSAETGWQINSRLLTDAELLNPSSDKTYMLHSPATGDTLMPLTSTELAAKRDECRTAYAQLYRLNEITKADDSNLKGIEALITTTTDMSGYI